MEFSRATVIMRGYTIDHIRTVGTIMTTSQKIKNIEVTLNTANAIEIIKELSLEFDSKLNIGAGTVLNFEELEAAVEVGATFVLSPNTMTKEMIEYCNKQGVLAIPGAFTPSEIATMFEYGAAIVKVFPANELSTNYAKKVCEPLGDLRLMAVGGVNSGSVSTCFSSGYTDVGSAGGIFFREDILKYDIEALTRSMKKFEEGIPE